MKLTDDERHELEQLVRCGAAGWKLRRAQTLLKCDEGEGGPGWSDAQIAEAFVAQMEPPGSYSSATCRTFPGAVVCMDGQPKQLICQTRPPITTTDGRRRVDHAYIREGVCHVWMFNEPLGG